MNAQFRIAVIALCGMLLGLPAAQAAEEFFHTRSVYIELDTSEDGHSTALPTSLTLQAGEHYRLELRNFSAEQHHVMLAPEFDRAIVTKGIRTYPQRDVIQGASLAKGISLLPGTRVEIYFQPKQEGRYKLFCEEQAHTRAGMEVAIDIRR
jgi:uncharacterized cupredoxin-like copper-binding protein